MVNILEAKKVFKSYSSNINIFKRKKIIVLDSFSLIVSESNPQAIAIAGESGSGKTTIARILLGLINPSEGIILYKGKEIRRLSNKEFKDFRKDIQAVFQDPFEVYNPFYKVEHILAIPINKFNIVKSKKEISNLIEESLAYVGLNPIETLDRYPHELSGGQRQRLMIARILALKSKVLITDEPVSMIDASLRGMILKGLLKLYNETGISLIYITHDLTTAYHLCKKIIILYKGVVVEVGNVKDVINNPRHPYTKLLVSSIPIPDPDLKWSEGTINTEEDLSIEDKIEYHKCIFVSRCSQVKDKCLKSPPELIQIENNHSVRCHNYKGQTVLMEDILNK